MASDFVLDCGTGEERFDIEFEKYMDSASTSRTSRISISIASKAYLRTSG
jgi:hypothetical protein